VALASGIGLLRGSRTALKAAYGLSGVLTVLGVSVTAMGAVMQANDDPSASPVCTGAFGAISLAFALLTWRLARSSLTSPTSVPTEPPSAIERPPRPGAA
jgi:hypothetical protein